MKGADARRTRWRRSRRGRARKTEVIRLASDSDRTWVVDVDSGPHQASVSVRAPDEEQAQKMATEKLQEQNWPGDISQATWVITEYRPVGAPPWACC